MSKHQEEQERLNAEEEQAEALRAEETETEETEADDTAETEELAESKSESEDNDKKEKKDKKKKKERTPEKEAERALNRVKRLKKLKYGTLATGITLVFLAIVIALNLILNILDDRFHWNIDLTSSGMYEMDEQTINYLHQIKTDVKITVLASENYFEDNQIKIVPETLARFRSESGNKISVEYVDTNKNPEAVTQYTKNYSGQLSQGDLIVSNKEGDLVRVLHLSLNNPSSSDIIKVEQTPNYQTMSYDTSISFIGEQSLLSAITGVTDLNPVTVAVIDTLNNDVIYNSSQTGFVRMLELLEKNNYTTEHIDIATDELSPDKYDYAILCAPYNDLTEAQVQKLTDFLNNHDKYGKTLLYFGSPLQRNLPNLNNFLDIWGVEVDRSILVESNNSTGQVVQVIVDNAAQIAYGVPVAAVTDQDLNKSYTSKLPIVAPYFSPVITKFSANAGRTTKPLLTTSETCYAEPLTEGAASDKKQQQFNLAVLSETTFTDDDKSYSSKLITFGSPFFLDYLVGGNSDTYGNADYFIKMLNSLTGKENALTIAEKSLTPTMITVTDSQRTTIRNIIVFIIPAIVALLGIFVYVRRKNK